MKRSLNGLLSLLSVVVLIGAVSVWARPEPTTKPSDDMEKPAAAAKKDKAAKPAKLTQPWSLLTTLTDEQKAKISEIHAKANAEKKAIDEKEETDIMALLSDEQKAELDKVNAAKKSAATEKKKAAKEAGKEADEKKKED